LLSRVRLTAQSRGPACGRPLTSDVRCQQPGGCFVGDITFGTVKALLSSLVVAYSPPSMRCAWAIASASRVAHGQHSSARSFAVAVLATSRCRLSRSVVVVGGGHLKVGASQSPSKCSPSQPRSSPLSRRRCRARLAGLLPASVGAVPLHLTTRSRGPACGRPLTSNVRQSREMPSPMRALQSFVSESGVCSSVGLGCPSFGGQRTDSGSSSRLHAIVGCTLRESLRRRCLRKRHAS
jgi:hypothetical protein